jgi:hypothetical protein
LFKLIHLNIFLYKTDDAGATFTLVQKIGLGTQGNIASLVKNGENGMMILGDGSQSATNYVDEMSLYGSRFWYDRLGRLTISQNSKQLNKGTGAYSYTVYDIFGKITEVGEITNRPAPTFEITNDDAKLKAWIAGGTKSEITRTYYNFQVFDVPGFAQENLRTRVSSTTYQDVAGADYDYATHYSYDIHGNVHALIQDNPKLSHLGQRFKKVEYEYDLISGKVNNVVYQRDQADEFRHKYEYDADNKLTNVFTSRDNIVWEQDAKYYYYQHGPLSRIEIGNDKVQGMDYAYNLQGWLKVVNSTSLEASREMGQDGHIATGNLHQNFAKDEFGFSLGYYKDDYKSIGRAPMSSDELFIASMRGSEIEQNNKDLYNGNISTMVTSVRKFMQGANASPVANQYGYDQLNRLKSVTTYQDPNVVASNQWAAGGTKQNAYSEKFTYDANGNILTLKRNADVNANASSTGVDDFTYIYENKANGFERNTNKLMAVKDATITANTPALKNLGDLQPGQQYSATNKSLNNYQYDEIGNLIKDRQEEIYNISWTVSGKIKTIERNQSSKKPDLEFGYDATGNRIYKIVKPRTGSGLAPETEWTTTYYTRDASGNQMAVYELKTKADADGSLQDQYSMKEFDIYGSSRLGVTNISLDQSSLAVAPYANRGYTLSKYDNNLLSSGLNSNYKSYVIGNKFFELSNHLGNVYNVLSDKKIAIDNNNDGKIDGYISDVVSASDFQAFGALRANRSFNGDAYRYSFQKQESDEELFGEGNSYFFKYRLEDSRIGRFYSIDPLSSKYPHYTPYSFSGNKLINCRELEGKEELPSFSASSIFALESRAFVHNSMHTAKQTAKVVKNNMGTVGTTIEVVGFVLYAIPVTSPEGAVLMKVGGAISNLNAGVSIAEKYVNGKKTSAKIELTYTLVGYGLGELINYQKLDNKAKAILLLTNSVYGKIAEQQLAIYDNQNIQKVGNITFDSNKVRKGKNGILIATDVKTGKEYGVVRQKDGSYEFHKNNNKK